MNSLMQQLYMIPSFRNDILAVEDPDKTTPQDDNLLFQTQCLFAALNQSVKQYYNPKLFCHAFKDWDKKPINVLEQMDVDEFFNLFLDKLENALKPTSLAKTIKRHFGGLFANQLICKDCPHSSVREEPFLALNLQVKNKRSLQQCLESFVEGEMLQGNNAYHCEKCDKKVTTLKRVCIRRLPRYLICVLKRFEFNYDTMQKFKVNDFCEFPVRLNMEQFTEEALYRRDREKEKERAKREGRDLEEDPNPPKFPVYPPEYYEYKLTGVLIHIGIAEAGHYYSLITDREKSWLPEKERWYEFNDTLVNQYDTDDLRDDAFGGEERFGGYDGFASRASEKIRNAYLLVYDRAAPYDPPEEDEDDVPSKLKPKELEIKTEKKTVISEDIQKAILAENVKYWHNKFMLSEDYHDFALKLCLKWNSSESLLDTYPSKNVDYELLGLGEDVAKRHAFQTGAKSIYVTAEESLKIQSSEAEINRLELHVFKYAATFLLTTLFRAAHKLIFPDFVDLTKAMINKHIEAAQWLVWQFCNPKIVHEFFFECGNTQVSRLVAGLIYCAMLKAYTVERQMMASGTATAETAVLPTLTNCLLNQLVECRKHMGSTEHFFQLLARLAALGPEQREYMLRAGTVKRLLGFWKLLPETGWNNFAEVPFKENQHPDLGLPSEVDERFRSPFEEYFAIKREQFYGYQNLQPFTFMLETMAILLRGTTLSPTAATVSPYALPGCLKGVGCDTTVKQLIHSPKILQGLIKDAKSSIALLEICKTFAHLAWEDAEFSRSLIKAIAGGALEVEWDELRRYFVVLKTLVDLEVPESLKEPMVDSALTELNVALRAGTRAFYATYFGVEYVLALAHGNKEVREWYKRGKERWEWMVEWLKGNVGSPAGELKLYKSKEQNERSGYTDSEHDPRNIWKDKITDMIKQVTAMGEGSSSTMKSENRRRVRGREILGDTTLCILRQVLRKSADRATVRYFAYITP